MTQDTKTPAARLRKIHASVLRWRRATSGQAPPESWLLSDDQLRFAADCERMRVDRNGSVLSLLLVRLHQQQPTRGESESSDTASTDTERTEFAFFARVLEGRLRVTDTPGRLKDGRVAILLPDTSAAGAWKVAADISEVYPPGPTRPECEVLVYHSKGHSKGRGRGHHASRHEGTTSFQEGKTAVSGPTPYQDSAACGDESDEVDAADSIHEEPEQEVAARPSDDRPEGAANSGSTSGSTGSSAGSSVGNDEFFFAKSHPLWKRALDICGGSVGLVASLPILAISAAMIKATSRGPAFFRQQREGHGGKRFDIWKLRTMHVDAEAQQHELRELSQQDGPAFKMKEDPRTTAVGRFLRWTSLDELPQFWNVLKGEMSLVGPRPLPTQESMACEGWQRRRLTVLPGMTCTWQVGERGNVSFDDWIRMDLRYAEDYDLLKDLRLMAVTPPSLLLLKGMR